MTLSIVHTIYHMHCGFNAKCCENSSRIQMSYITVFLNKFPLASNDRCVLKMRNK